MIILITNDGKNEGKEDAKESNGEHADVLEQEVLHHCDIEEEDNEDDEGDTDDDDEEEEEEELMMMMIMTETTKTCQWSAASLREGSWPPRAAEIT